MTHAFPTRGPSYLSGMDATTIPLTQCDDFAETRVADRLSQVDGVAQVVVYGSKKYAARLYLNPQALNARGLSLLQVGEAIGKANSNRSEEHTSELPSLMRISYAVFCLKKKKKRDNQM